MGILLLLAFTLSLDSFRVSLGLGATRPRPARQAQIALAFALCDGLAPLVGLMLGRSFADYVGGWSEYLGPLVLCAYGLYTVYVARRCAEGQEEASGWVVFGLPLTLSLDNLVAGASLGLEGFPVLLSVAVIGAMSGLMSFAGLRLGGMAVNFLRLRSELLGGVALIFIALALAVETLREGQ
ncbi:MAG TPA: manganese efflux pump [Pyrinomonadaceae bacterium]